jgi:hypothetical protein
MTVKCYSKRTFDEVHARVQSGHSREAILASLKLKGVQDAEHYVDLAMVSGTNGYGRSADLLRTKSMQFQKFQNQQGERSITSLLKAAFKR